MKSISPPCALTLPLVGRAGGTARRRRRFVLLAAADGLELRLVLSAASAAVPAVAMLSATTTDSKSVSIAYEVNQASDATNPIEFGVYRSSNGEYSAGDPLVGTFTVTPPGGSAGQADGTLDQSGKPAGALGSHQLVIPLPQGLAPAPEKPYVVVVADPSAASATTDPQQSASFRTYTIGIVTHGGIQDPSWTHGPPWELEMAYVMKHEGYDAVIPYNWVLQSGTPGDAIKQSARLARIILDTASRFPANDPVNLDFIGHSEGTVVNTYAIVSLEKSMTPNLEAGYMVDTLLDPHAANNSLPGQQISFRGPLAGLAWMIVTDYQHEAKDPPAFVPSVVDLAQVFFQHTPASAGGIYNLWGQVPVRSEGPVVHYYNLTDMGVTHSGKTGVSWWYRDFVVPTLGDGAPLIQKLQLNGQIDNAQPSAAMGASTATIAPSEARADRIYGASRVVQTSQPEFSGTAAPGSFVRLLISPATKPWESSLAGRTIADGNGNWSLTTSHPLRSGQYRTLVSTFSRALRTRRGLAIVPTEPLGRLVVDAPS
jgi:hypothetical protein